MEARGQARRESSGADKAPVRGGLYRPRDPCASPLWQCATRHGTELREAGRLRRAVEEQVIGRFIECGDPHHGFARIYCDACAHDYLLAYSCKTRYFCPSCHQKRVLLYGEWIEKTVLAPVPHRPWLGELCRIAARLLVDAYVEAASGTRPSSCQLRLLIPFGDLIQVQG